MKVFVVWWPIAWAKLNASFIPIDTCNTLASGGPFELKRNWKEKGNKLKNIELLLPWKR